MPNTTKAPPLLLESIRLYDGATDLLPYHQKRVNRSRRTLYAKSPALKLSKVLETMTLPQKGLYKIRVEYARAVHKTEVIPYTPKAIASLRIVDADKLDYGKKYADRSGIRKCLERKGKADDVLMVQQGHVTDTSYANVALFDGTWWYTPAWPLLRGARREALVDAGTIKPIVIRERDLGNFSRIRLINAMLPWAEAIELGMDSVVR